VKLYLDLCAWNRPLDDLSQPRVNLEAQAVILILEACERGRHDLVTSTALEVENAQNPDGERRAKIAELLKRTAGRVDHNSALDQRVQELVRLGFQAFDAYHVASAESARCDRLVTTDDRLLKAAGRSAGIIQVQVTGPLQLIAEPDFQ
jgi:predicted nucleic acid-binding protein